MSVRRFRPFPAGVLSRLLDGRHAPHRVPHSPGWPRTLGAWLASAISTRNGRAEAMDVATRPWEGSIPHSKRALGLQQLEQARAAFESMLDGVPAERIADDMPSLPVDLRLSIGLADLWALRPALFEMAARHFDQAEAARRLARLDQAFPPPRAARAAPGPARDGGRAARTAQGRVAGVTGAAPH